MSPLPEGMTFRSTTEKCSDISQIPVIVCLTARSTKLLSHEFQSAHVHEECDILVSEVSALKRTISYHIAKHESIPFFDVILGQKVNRKETPRSLLSLRRKNPLKSLERQRSGWSFARLVHSLDGYFAFHLRQIQCSSRVRYIREIWTRSRRQLGRSRSRGFLRSDEVAELA